MKQSSPRALRIFLCHANQDKPSVRRLYKRLSAAGMHPWFDEKDLLPGQDWSSEIQKAVRSSDVVVVCLSSRSIAKEGYVQKEIRYALDMADEKPEDTIFIIPLKLEECAVPERLKNRQWVDYYRRGGYDRLLQSLNRRAQALGTLTFQKTKKPSRSRKIDARNLALQSKPPSSPKRQPSKTSPWRIAGTQHSWGGRKELPWLQSLLATASAALFEKLALALLRLAMAPPGQRLYQGAFQALGGGYLVSAGEVSLPVFIQLMFFEERAEDLDEAQVRRCREAMRRFARGPVQAEAYLFVYNLDPRSAAFREGLGRELEALRASGRVTHVLTWGSRDLLEAAFDGLFDFTLAMASRGNLSSAPIERALADFTDLLSQVPLQVSWLTTDQKILALCEELEKEAVEDPVVLLLDGKPPLRTLLLGDLGFGKTTVVARSLLRKDFQFFYVTGASLTREIATSKAFLSRCLNTESLFADCPPEDREIYERMLRAVAEQLFKDPSLPCALVIDGLDESPFLCRGAGLTYLLNNLEPVRVPVVLAMRSEYWLSRRGDLESTVGKLKIQGEPRIRQVLKLELLPWRDDEILQFVRRFRETRLEPAERERLGDLEALVTNGRYGKLYGDIPRRPLFLRLIAELAAATDLPTEQIGRARLFRDWVLWKIRRDLRDERPHLVFEGEPTEEVLETAWEAMLWAAASMTQEHEGKLELLPDCSFDHLRRATPRLEKRVDVLVLSLRSLLVLSRERTEDWSSFVTFAHQAFKEFFLAWFLAENHRDRDWLLPSSVQEWITDLRREGLVNPAVRRETERPPGLPPPPTRPIRWQSLGATSRSRTLAAEPADLILHVIERPGGQRRLFELLLTARNPVLDLDRRPFGTIEMATSPAEFLRHHLKEVDEGGALGSQGAFLAEQLLQPDLRKTLSSLRHQVKTFQIVSDDLWIPWEILRIEENPDSEVVDGPFLAEAFALTRWLHPIRQTTYLPLSRIAAVVPRDSDLPHAEKEWVDLQDLVGNGREVERIPARLHEVEEAFRAGVYNGWHFTSHGFFRENAPDFSQIWLEEDESLTPVHLGGEAKRMGVTRPLVFLNACTGQSGLSLTGVGVWARYFLEAGAGAFLGPLWPVRDLRSRDFARAFYKGFTDGLPLAEAVQAARQAIRSDTDPTWLAYTVFGHPLAVCRPVPEI